MNNDEKKISAAEEQEVNNAPAANEAPASPSVFSKIGAWWKKASTGIKSAVIAGAAAVVIIPVVLVIALGGNNGGQGGSQGGPTGPVLKEYTYNSYTSSLGSNWNPHSWETSADSGIAGYLEMPFVTMQAKDTENGIYQWIYEMATAITDVTATHQGDLTKYGSTLPTKEVEKVDEEGNPVLDEEGNPVMETVPCDPSEVTSGYVYEIKLNPDAKWQNGDVINADSYIYSMEKLLNSKMRNYRANLYYAGESAVAGGAAYFNSEAPIYTDVYNWDTGESVEGETYYINLTAGWSGNTDYSFKIFLEDYGFIYDEYEVELDENGEPKVDENGEPVYVLDENGEKVLAVCGATYYKALEEQVNPYGYVEVTEENEEMVQYLIVQFMAAFGYGPTDALEYIPTFQYYISGIGEKVEFDAVGLYKVDDYTINYVCQTAIDINYFLTSCTSTWLVHPATYEATMKEEGGLTITKYGTSVDTSMSYGPYMMQSFEDGKQVVFVQNPNWYGWEKDADGNLVSYTDYEVDGEKRQRYQTTKIVIDVMTNDVAYQKFLKGELMDYAPTPEELTEYTLSDRLTRVDETYTMSFFFNTGLETLKSLDEGANENSVVLSNYNFRKAFSLAFNRADFVTVTEGYTPAYSLMNKLYHYDIYNDPTSSYRASEPAMQAICNLYGVKYGEGEIYKTLEEAYNSITGYNLDEAKALMKIACEELVEAGLYTKGEPIKIQIGWKKGAMEDPDNAQVAKVQEYLNAAVEGSGFGEVTIEGVGNLDDRYSDVPAGKFAIGYGAWGGAAFYPFRNMQVYCDTIQYAGQINETGCWNPATTELTINVNGEDVTMTWEEWSRSMIGTGPFATADNETKLKITAIMEEEFLKFYYRIPLCGTTICSLLSYKADYYTWDYNIMYSFGGLELMTYNYTDAEWAEYVAAQGGTLNYK